jgi:hypothetical protein
VEECVQVFDKSCRISQDVRCQVLGLYVYELCILLLYQCSLYQNHHSRRAINERSSDSKIWRMVGLGRAG